MSSRRALLLNVLLSLTVTLVFAALLEGLCRLYEKRHPRPEVEDYIWDWQEKWEGDFYTIRSEVSGWPPWQEFNADGLRDRSHSLKAPGGTTRVVFLGDSVTLGDQILPAEAYPQQLQARYDAEGRPIEVFNVALWGWSTRQQRRAFREIARKYEPRQVILAVCLNDLPELQNNLAQPPGWLAALHRRSALVRRVVNAQGREIQSVEQLFSDPTAPRVHEAFRRFFAEVRALRAEVQATGAGFGMMVFPFRFQVAPGAPPPVVQSRIAEFCGRESLACLDLLPAVRRLGEAAYVDYDHLNPAGMALVTGEVAISTLLPEVAAAATRLGGRASFESAQEHLLDPDPAVRAAAAWALGRARQKEGALEAEALLFALLDDTHDGVRHAAARGLDGAPALSKATRDRLFQSLQDDSEPVRWAAARALATSGTSEADVPRLGDALSSSDTYVRGFAAFCLGEIGAPAASAVPALIAALRAEDGYDRGGAASALARIGPAASAAVPALLEGLRSTDGDRRWKAARILGRIGAPATEAVPDLVRALRDPNEYVRAHAAKALGRIGLGGPEVMTALTESTGDPDETVRREAEAALLILRRKTGA
jgi:HEAT repeat protein